MSSLAVRVFQVVLLCFFCMAKSQLKSNDQGKRCSLQALTYCPMTIQGALSQYDMDMLDARTEARAKAHFQNPTGSSAENKSNLCPSRLMSIRNQFLCDSMWFIFILFLTNFFHRFAGSFAVVKIMPFFPTGLLINRRYSGVTRNRKLHFHA